MCDGRPRDVIMEIDASEFIFINNLSFLADASSGVLFKAKTNERILTYDVVFPLLAFYLEHVDVAFFLKIIDETDLDNLCALLAF